MKTSNTIYRNRILDLVKELKFATPERVRKVYMKRYNTISWITIKRHLEILYKEGYIEKEILSKGKKRTMVIFTNIKEI